MRVQDALCEAITALQNAGVESPSLDAQLIMAFALGCKRLDVLSHPERELGAIELSHFQSLIARRISREPLAYIIGTREFHGLEIDVSAGVLVPRPETEILVEEVAKRITHNNPMIAEVGVGSGAISVALACLLPDATVYATDISKLALKVAGANAEKHGVADRVRVIEGDMLEPLADMQFDVVVSNPPYIPSADIATLEPEVRDYEPREALDGGVDGLDAYRRMLPEAVSLLKPGAFVAVEVGMGQAQDVCNIAKAAGYSRTDIARDLAGIERVVVVYR